MEELSDVRFKQRAVIEFLIAGKVPPIEIHRRMQAVYGDQRVDVNTVRRWVRRLIELRSAVRKWFQKQKTIFLRSDFKN